MSRTIRSFAAAGTVGALAILLSGCISLPPIDLTDATPISTPTPEDEGQGGITDEEFEALVAEVVNEIDEAVAVTDAFWAANWSEYFTGDYVAPNVVGLYDGTDPNETVTCNGEVPEAGNAFYCGLDDSLVWDAGLMLDAYTEGDAIIWFIVAHEWGHAIQARLDPSILWAADELEADCFSAAALYGADADGLMDWDPGDSAEIANGITALSDETAWTSVEDHGDPFDRIDAFNDGRQGGVNACLVQE